MALLTEELVITNEWTKIDLLDNGTKIVLEGTRGAPVLYRFGVNSDSLGIPFGNEGSKLIVDEPIYVRSQRKSSILIVTRDTK